MAELLAGVAAVLRRSSGVEEQKKLPDHDEAHISHGALVIYPEKYEVTLSGEPITSGRRNLKYYCIWHVSRCSYDAG